jgi:hypothetical protein
VRSVEPSERERMGQASSMSRLEGEIEETVAVRSEMDEERERRSARWRVRTSTIVEMREEEEASKEREEELSPSLTCMDVREWRREEG